jgi:CO/xanthine dehydrogenase Mo-binding subunit
MDSHRLAPKGLYTSRTDIPVYRMSQAGAQSMMYAVVMQNAAEEARIADHERRIINEIRGVRLDLHND